MDISIRTEQDCEIEVEADLTLELHWPVGEDSSVTIHVPPAAAKRLSERLAELVVLIPGEVVIPPVLS